MRYLQKTVWTYRHQLARVIVICGSSIILFTNNSGLESFENIFRDIIYSLNTSFSTVTHACARERPFKSLFIIIIFKQQPCPEQTLQTWNPSIIFHRD